MKTRSHLIVFVTAPNKKVARQLAQGALEKRLVACANLIPGIESHYWWEGKIERGNELLVLFKTTASKLKSLEKFIIANHPYDTPEFVVTSLVAGNKRYLKWLSDSVK